MRILISYFKTTYSFDPSYLFTGNLAIFFNLSQFILLMLLPTTTRHFSFSFIYSSREKSWNFSWQKSSSTITRLFHERHGNYLKSRRPRDYHKALHKVERLYYHVAKQRRDQYDAFSIHDSPRIVTHTRQFIHDDRARCL